MMFLGVLLVDSHYTIIMKFLNTQILVSIVLFMEIATLVEGATDGIGKAANFDVSYLDADIPDQTIKNDTLGAEQAVNQVFLAQQTVVKEQKVKQKDCYFLSIQFLAPSQRSGQSISSLLCIQYPSTLIKYPLK